LVNKEKNAKWLSIKDVCSQGRAGCPMRTFFGKGVSSDADIRTFSCKKLCFFRNLWWARADKGGWASADILQTRGRVNFSRFCAYIFYGRSPKP